MAEVSFMGGFFFFVFFFWKVSELSIPCDSTETSECNSLPWTEVRKAGFLHVHWAGGGFLAHTPLHTILYHHGLSDSAPLNLYVVKGELQPLHIFKGKSLGHCRAWDWSVLFDFFFNIQII